MRQRYDLTGDSRIHVPLVVDLEQRTFLWADVHLSALPGHHSAGRHRGGLGRIAQDLSGYFSSGRTTLWDLAVWHAAARAEETLVLRDGGLLRYSRRLGETLPGFSRAGSARAGSPTRAARRPTRRPPRPGGVGHAGAAGPGRRLRGTGGCVGRGCTGCCRARSTGAAWSRSRRRTLAARLG